MITLITGTPGTGKTAMTVSLLLNDSEYKNRALFQHGIVDFKMDAQYIYCHAATCKVCKKLTDEQKAEMLPVNKWNEWAPDGALIIIDEVQKIYRPTSAASRVTPDLEAFEDHRHNGIDFIVVTQGPKLVHTNLRALVNRHVHIVSGWAGRWRYQWDEISDNVQARTGAVKKRHKLDKKTFDLYKSATSHTKVDRSIPTSVYVFGVMLLVLVVGGFKVYFKVYGETDSVPFVLSEVEPMKDKSNFFGGGGASSFDFKPAVEHVAESAPAYNKVRKVADFPRLSGCIRNDKKCKCYNQQGSVYETSLKQCLKHVREPKFNPYYEKKNKTQETASHTEKFGNVDRKRT